MGYSIAIRTLGTSGEKFKQELDSIAAQTVKPDKVVVYIAEGYAHPQYTIGIEQYVEVKKGMVAQRALPYDEIDSDYMLLLDDDIKLAPDSAERMIRAIEEFHLTCVAADLYQDHNLSIYEKLKAIATSLVFPHWSKKWAFKIHANESSSYNNNPSRDFYFSQSAAGAVCMWVKNDFLALHYEDELWMDNMEFAYNDDTVIFHKIVKNGYSLGVLYNTGSLHLDGKTSNSGYQKNLQRFYTRSKASTIIWYRICYDLPTNTIWQKIWAVVAYSIKCLWLFFINLAACIPFKSLKVVGLYVKGIVDGLKLVGSKEYKAIPNYIVKIK